MSLTTLIMRFREIIKDSFDCSVIVIAYIIHHNYMVNIRNPLFIFISIMYLI